MTYLHEVIASDAYWEYPVVQDVKQPPTARDLLTSEAIMNGINRSCQEIKDHGAQTRRIEYGEEVTLGSAAANSILKVIEDRRVHPKVGTQKHQYVTPELFDAQAQAMDDELLYVGGQPWLRVGTSERPMSITRKAAYFRRAASDKQLVGKASYELRLPGAQSYAIFMRTGIPVGHIRQFETRKDYVQSRIISAEILTPGGPRKVQGRNW